jgi:hypothetical protein
MACVSGTSGTIPTPTGDDAPPVDDGIHGEIATNTTWSGTVRITGGVTIDTGVTVTVAPGTSISTSGTAAYITVNGILDASGGTKAAPITIGGGGGVTISAGGSATYSYVDHEGGGVHTIGTATFTATDSKLSNANGGDFLTMAGGTINVTYSTLGETTGATSTHCNLHFDSGTGNNIVIQHSNIGGAPFGVMFYGGDLADLTFNNWMGNSVDVDSNGYTVSGDFSNSYFALGAPVQGTGNTFTLTNISTTVMVTPAGPR